MTAEYCNSFCLPQAPVGLCTLIHPGVEDCTNGPPQLRFGIVGELLSKLQLNHGFVGLDQVLQVFGQQLAVLHRSMLKGSA